MLAGGEQQGEQTNAGPTEQSEVIDGADSSLLIDPQLRRAVEYLRKAATAPAAAATAA
jgi:hypothetical protein